MLVMILVGVAIFVFAIAMVWFLLAHGSRVAGVTKEDFDGEYNELVAEGQAVEGDRDAAWRNFHAWQRTSEQEWLSWEEESDD
jgi:hypothetical protein